MTQANFPAALAGLLLMSLATVSYAQEQQRYVSDDLTTWTRRGPGENYRLAGTLKAGEAVTLLQTDSDGKYAEVRDGGGRTLWLPVENLTSQPSFRSRVPALEEKVKALTGKLDHIEQDWQQRTGQMQEKVRQSDSVIEALQAENSKLKNALTVAEKKVEAANVQLDDKQRAIILQWFLYGGGVLAAGLILGLVLPYLLPRRRRKDRWMN